MTNMFIAERNLLCQNYVDKAQSVWICSTVVQSFSTLLKANCPRGCLLEGIMALSVVPQTVAVIDDIHLLDFLCILFLHSEPLDLQSGTEFSASN